MDGWGCNPGRGSRWGFYSEPCEVLSLPPMFSACALSTEGVMPGVSPTSEPEWAEEGRDSSLGSGPILFPSVDLASWLGMDGGSGRCSDALCDATIKGLMVSLLFCESRKGLPRPQLLSCRAAQNRVCMSRYCYKILLPPQNALVLLLAETTNLQRVSRVLPAWLLVSSLACSQSSAHLNTHVSLSFCTVLFPPLAI